MPEDFVAFKADIIQQVKDELGEAFLSELKSALRAELSAELKQEIQVTLAAEQKKALKNKKKATIFLFSDSMDKTLIAFIIATGYAAMGVEVKMWFTLWGANCLRVRRGMFHSWFRNRKHQGGEEFRRMETDMVLQKMVDMLNRGGANHLSLSKLNLLGLGPVIFNTILKRKKIPNVAEMIEQSKQLGISFTICQICVDSLALDTNDLIVDADVKGVSQYMKDAMDAHYNVFI